MKKVNLYIFCFTTIFLLTCFHSFAVAEKNTMEKPEWRVGDTWVLEGTVYSEDKEFTGLLKYEIVEKTDINLNGSIYEVFKIEVTNPLEDHVYYYDAETLSLVRDIRTTKIPGEDDWEVTNTNFTNIWPVYVNKTVNWTSERIVKYDWGYDNETFNFSEKCTDIVNLDTPLGKLRSFEIKRYVNGVLERVNYWSEEYGFIIKHTYYNDDGSVKREAILESIGSLENETDEDGSENQNDQNTIFLVAVLFVLIIILSIFVYKILQSKKR